MRISGFVCGLALIGVAAVAARPASLNPAAADYAQVATQPAPTPTRSPDVIYVPTPDEVVAEMLKVAAVTPKDLVYDLGCGDGRIVVAAAKLGARGVGFDLDPQRIKEARENVEKSGVGDKVEIRQADLFETDLSKADVITLYLLPSLNQKLRPKLWKELRVGARVVSHAFDMGTEWAPDQELDVSGRKVYFWTIKTEHKKATGS